MAVAAQRLPSHHSQLDVPTSTSGMPHALYSHDPQAEQDELDIAKLLNPENNEGLEFLSRPLELGEKAKDALDYEDIGDDDLAEEEDVGPVSGVNGEDAGLDGDAFGGADGLGPEGMFAEPGDEAAVEDDGFGDLFGDLPSPSADRDVSNFDLQTKQAEGVGVSFDSNGASQLPESSKKSTDLSGIQSQKHVAGSDAASHREGEASAKDLARAREQQALFAMSKSQLPPPPPESNEELLASLWPKYVHHATPYWMDLIPQKKAHYIGKTPLKPPKPVQPTKINLELANGQEKAFKIAGPAVQKRANDVEAEQKGVIYTFNGENSAEASDDDMELDVVDENEKVGGVSWQDLTVLCADWDTISVDGSSDDLQSGTSGRKRSRDDTIVGDDGEIVPSPPPAKRQKPADVDPKIFALPPIKFPSFEDPERTTFKLARSVALDLNDPQLLVDMHQHDLHPNKRRRLNGDSARGTNFSKNLSQRYNVSNDEAYDLLKENHQSKIRSTIGTLTVEHSMPALRLQYPYYKIKLHKSEAREFHRPAMKFTTNTPVTFSKPRLVKRKHMKGRDVQNIFETTKDLSLGDNSSALLLEYSEEHPTMMSNFGMGSRVINYYRRKDMEDSSRPKLDVGETQILLPQDKSPFSVFGNVDPGESVPTFHNAMYRAPLFKQQAKSTDFLVVRNRTGVDGAFWYLRNVENLYIVGQEFPLVDVPGPHSRKVTTASKNRLKMISFRKLKKNRPHRINVAEITKHFPDTTDMQNRQKMKEFMQFSKEHKEWEMRPGDAIPDEATLRAMVKPEDVCLLESMQVGQRHLLDAGYTKEDEDAEEDDNKEGQSMAQQLAPWHTTRNFLNATQGKAMLQLHGEGDPSGRGEAFSFVRTSMKGGFKAAGESAEAKIEAKKSKEAGGHSYNVARQQKAYEDSIRRIWDAQTHSLSAIDELSDAELDDEHAPEPEDLFGGGKTPRSEAATPAPSGRRDDDTTSQFSRFSTSSQSGKVLRIDRQVVDENGNREPVQEIVRDPRIIRQYLKRRHAIEADNLKLSELKPTGDAERDKRAMKNLQTELARLERNKDRRIARDKQKGVFTDGAGSPGSPSSPAEANKKPAGTARKCANCGKVGHIKTNKKCC
ncbi:MAG: hypothetical protein M1835_006858 [Candelina submexicana]|nr:MAG: hypothetical protein M1835_006858 [Candelina submexicana]